MIMNKHYKMLMKFKKKFKELKNYKKNITNKQKQHINKIKFKLVNHFYDVKYNYKSNW